MAKKKKTDETELPADTGVEYGQFDAQPYGAPQPQPQQQAPAPKAKVKYIPRSFLWNVIAICLAFFFGIFVCLGAIVGGLAIAAKQFSVKKVLSFAGADSSKYVSEAYLDQSILDLAGDLLDDVRNNRITNLNAIGKYSPMLKSMLNSVAGQLSDMGITLDVDELMGVEFSTLGTYMSDNVIQSISIGDVMKLTGESSPLMLNLCYGEEDEDYTVVDGKIIMNEGKCPTIIKDLIDGATNILGRIQIGNALNVTAKSEAVMRYLAYGSEGTDYDIVDGEIVMKAGKKPRTISSLTDADANLVGNAKICDLVTLDENSSDLMKAISDWKIFDLTNGYKIQRLKIGQLMTLGDNPSPFLNAMQGWRIEELTKGGKLDTVPLGDLINVTNNSPDIVKALQDTPLCDLSAKIETLRLSSILGESATSGNKLLKNLKESTLKSLADDLGALTVEDVFGDELYAYLSLKASGNKTYDDLLSDYEKTGKTSATLSAIRPESIADNAVISTHYVLKTNGKAVTQGYFLGDTPVAKDNVYRTESGYSIMLKTIVTPTYAWHRVDYDAGALTALEAGATVREEEGGFVYGVGDKTYPVKEDAFSFYIQKEDERIDLDRTVMSYTLDGKSLPVEYGQITADGKTYTVYTHGDENYIERAQEVTLRYLSEDGKRYTENDVTVRQTASWTDKDGTVHTDEEVDRYLDGIWYLLFGSSKKGAAIELEELSSYVSDAQTVLSKTELWKLYFHGIINENPYCKLKTGGNLNDYSIDGMIDLLKKTL